MVLFFRLFCDFIACCFNKCFYAAMIVGGYRVFIIYIFIFHIFEISSKLYSPKKSSNCFFIVSLLILFCIGTKFQFLSKSLHMPLQKILVLRYLIHFGTCPARLDWNLIVSSSIFHNLINHHSFFDEVYDVDPFYVLFFAPVRYRDLELFFKICAIAWSFSFFCFFLVIVLCFF